MYCDKLYFSLRHYDARESNYWMQIILEYEVAPPEDDNEEEKGMKKNFLET
jgi:hypothetical protein